MMHACLCEAALVIFLSFVWSLGDHTKPRSPIRPHTGKHASYQHSGTLCCESQAAAAAAAHSSVSQTLSGLVLVFDADFCLYPSFVVAHAHCTPLFPCVSFPHCRAGSSGHTVVSITPAHPHTCHIRLDSSACCSKHTWAGCFSTCFHCAGRFQGLTHLAA